MNYGELKTAIIGYLQNTDVDLLNNLDTIVLRTQKRLRNLRVPEKEVRFNGNAPDIVLPTDLEEIKEVWAQSERNPDTGNYDEDYPEGFFGHLKPVSWQWMSSKIQIDGGSQPLYYARRKLENGDDSMRLFPTGAKYSIEITYYASPPALVNDTDSNVYSLNFQDLMIYGSVAEAYRWLRTEDKMMVWEGMFKELYLEVEQAGKNRDYRGGTLVMDSPSHRDSMSRGW